VRAPDRVHHLLRVLRIALVDRDDRAVVEAAGLRQVVVHDVRDDHLEQGQEEAFGGLASGPSSVAVRPTTIDWSIAFLRSVIAVTVSAGNGSTGV